MHKNLLTCSAEDIIEVNQRKEYTLISTRLLQSLFADPNLNPQAIKCWQLLFNLARFNPNLEITMSYTKIANELKRSKRTIIRYIQTLIQSGYLETIANFDAKYGKKANTLLVRVPATIMNNVKISKDRITVKEIQSTHEVFYPTVSSNKTTEESQTKTILQNSFIDIIPDKQNLVTASIDPTESTNITEHAQEKIISNKQTPEMPFLETKVSLAPSDTLGTANNNINYINNNNNVVVYDSSNPEKNTNFISNDPQTSVDDVATQISQLTLKKEQLEKLDEQEGKKLAGFAGDTTATYKHLQYLGSIRNAISTIKNNISRLTKKRLVTLEERQKQNDVTTKIDCMFKKPGERMITIFTFNRVVKTLGSLGYKDNDLIWLINEIIFEIRFGSLIKSAATGAILSTDHAINIALKLVRQQRWTTPVLFKKYAEKN